jgi:hypothetical protein
MVLQSSTEDAQVKASLFKELQYAFAHGSTREPGLTVLAAKGAAEAPKEATAGEQRTT